MMKTFSDKYGKKDLIFVIVMVSLLLWFLWWVKYKLPTTTAFDDINITVGVVYDTILVDSVTLVFLTVDGEYYRVNIKGDHSFPIGEKVIIVRYRDDRLRFTMKSWW